MHTGLVIYSRGRLQNVEYDIAAFTIYVEYQSWDQVALKCGQSLNNTMFLQSSIVNSQFASLQEDSSVRRSVCWLVCRSVQKPFFFQVCQYDGNGCKMIWHIEKSEKTEKRTQRFPRTTVGLVALLSHSFSLSHPPRANLRQSIATAYSFSLSNEPHADVA